MAQLYTDVDKSTWVYQPNFTRSRAKYRGSRESYKLNLEISQILYDFRKLYEKFDTLDTTLSLDLTGLEFGASFSATYVWGTNPVATLAIKGSNDLSLRITKLKMRIKALEEGN